MCVRVRDICSANRGIGISVALIANFLVTAVELSLYEFEENYVFSIVRHVSLSPFAESNTLKACKT